MQEARRYGIVILGATSLVFCRRTSNHRRLAPYLIEEHPSSRFANPILAARDLSMPLPTEPWSARYLVEVTVLEFKAPAQVWGLKKVHALCGGDPYPMSIPGKITHE